MKEVIPKMDSTFPFQLIWDVSGFSGHSEDQRCYSALPWQRQSSPSAQHGHPGHSWLSRVLLKGTGAVAAQLTAVVTEGLQARAPLAEGASHVVPQPGLVPALKEIQVPIKRRDFPCPAALLTITSAAE